MSVNKILVQIAMAVSGIFAVIALVGFLHVLFTSHGFHQLIHELENWATTVAYYLALTLLATAGIFYLANRK